MSPDLSQKVRGLSYSAEPSCCENIPTADLWLTRLELIKSSRHLNSVANYDWFRSMDQILPALSGPGLQGSCNGFFIYSRWSKFRRRHALYEAISPALAANGGNFCTSVGCRANPVLSRWQRRGIE